MNSSMSIDQLEAQNEIIIQQIRRLSDEIYELTVRLDENQADIEDRMTDMEHDFKHSTTSIDDGTCTLCLGECNVETK